MNKLEKIQDKSFVQKFQSKVEEISMLQSEATKMEDLQSPAIKLAQLQKFISDAETEFKASIKPMQQLIKSIKDIIETKIDDHKNLVVKFYESKVEITKQQKENKTTGEITFIEKMKEINNLPKHFYALIPAKKEPILDEESIKEQFPQYFKQQCIEIFDINAFREEQTPEVIETLTKEFKESPMVFKFNSAGILGTIKEEGKDE